MSDSIFVAGRVIAQPVAHWFNLNRCIITDPQNEGVYEVVDRDLQTGLWELTGNPPVAGSAEMAVLEALVHASPDVLAITQEAEPLPSTVETAPDLTKVAAEFGAVAGSETVSGPPTFPPDEVPTNPLGRKLL